MCFYRSMYHGGDPNKTIWKEVNYDGVAASLTTMVASALTECNPFMFQLKYDTFVGYMISDMALF